MNDTFKISDDIRENVIGCSIVEKRSRTAFSLAVSFFAEFE